ncbi:MAG: long-chain-fatty-acid--CoA ligase [Pseudomonadales bacterium]|jgi:acyl-CoA synthetase (AMP-forming)/AMP-acid ligase II|nr:long-chain-fatty-acid--CoA ligase [Pseudomonadales bacterium]
MEHNISALLEKRAFLHPDREAFVDGSSDLRLSYGELATRSARVANALRGLGVGPGDRVGLLLMNGAEFVESFFAIGRIGAVVVPLNWRLVADELTFILDDSGTRALLYGEEFADVVADLHGRGDRTPVRDWIEVGEGAPQSFATPYEVWRDGADALAPPLGARGDDLLYIMYTSGTTGLPKGVVHTHDTALWGVLTIAGTADLRPKDRYLQPLPLFHVGALTPATLVIYAGATIVSMRSFDPRLAWELIDRERVTTGLAVPAMLNFMLQVPPEARGRTDSVRWCMSGAAPVPTSLIEAYADIGVEILQVYGLTETCGPACLIDSENALARVGSTGKAFLLTDVRVVDEAGTDCPPGVAGEVLVRGPHVMKAYWNRPDATAETLVDGWLRTGDVAVMDEDGFVFIQDRIKDMIISGGENIYPAEIEGVLQAHPGVSEAAVIGQPSERWGESPFALVVRIDPQLAEADLLKWCSEQLARYKLPKGVAFVEEIPRNPSGKILKRVLREEWPGPAAE